MNVDNSNANVAIITLKHKSHIQKLLIIIQLFFINFRSTGASPAVNNSIGNSYHHADCESCYSEPPEPTTCVPNSQYDSLFFADGERSIDFVIVWQPAEERDQEDLNCIKRAIFEDNLVNEGLELEHDCIDQLHFTKIHTPFEVLRRYSEILKLRMPMKEVSCNWFYFWLIL